MLVAFRVGFGDDGKAVAGLLSEVIGSIQTVKGCCTIRRASGVAVQVSPGDPICQEDVIETAADGRIGICFLDGTVFDLFPGTRLALHEFICDANGTSHSLLVGVTGGTFAFMAGRVAETSRLAVDTPFGSIRGRAHSGGFGMLWLTALTLSMLGEVRAADPDVAILDDDRIAYKDLDFGVLEITTKEPIPKYIRVEDPEQTIVLHQQERGSSVSVNQVTNSAARMEELQAAQRDVLANYAQGIGGNGSGTPPSSVNSSPVQRINYTPADLPTLQNSPPAPLLTFTAVPEIITGKPPPEPPALTVVAGPTEIDTVAFDQFTATSGTFHASSSNSGTLTYGIDGGTAGSTILDGVTYDLSRTGPFGTLYLNSTSGAFSFVPDGGAINALTATTITSFTVTVSDGTLSTSRTFPITINGVNDAAVISGTTAGAVIEAGVATSGAPTATGTLTDTDVDNPVNTFTAVGPTPSTHGYSSFAMTAAGVWTYTLDNANGAVQALNAGNTLSDSFTVTTVDGTPQVVTITITGSNDSAVISGTTTGAVTEAGSTPGTSTANGTLFDSDVDNPANTFTAVGPTPSAQGYGSFAMTAAGGWTYTLDNANSAVQALNAGGILTDSFTVTTVDGTPQVVTITITGSNDSAVISGSTAGAVTETGSATPGMPTANGTLFDSDVDNPFNTFTAVGPTPSAQGYGSFAMTAAGVWTYTLDNANSAVQALNAGGILTDSFTVTTVDGTPQVVTITITGSNDSAVISGSTAGAVTETGSATPGIPTATGTLVDADLDNPANTFTAVGPTPSAQGYGSFAMTAAGVWTYTLDNANGAVQALNAGGILTDSFTVTTVDGTPQVVTITITGSNDSAVISGSTAGAVTETGSATPGMPTANGTLFDSDVDNPFNTFTAVGPTPSAQGYGSFAMTAAGVWTYTLDNANSAVQALNAGGILTDSFTVTTVDGTPQVVTITITGSNDSAVISGSTAGAVTETGSATPGIPTATGTLVDADLDNPANTFTAVGPTPSAQGYGSFAMTAAGVWTYTLDNANGAVQALNAGNTLSDSFTVTTVDGTQQVVTITITGSNDSAVITGTTTGTVTETGSATPGTPTATRTLFDTDVDNPFNTFTAVGPTPSTQGYGNFAMTAAGVWTYTLDNANSAVQALNAGNTLSDSFTMTTVDGTPQVVTITITGSNDSAIISGTTTGAVTEAGSTPGTPTATGTLFDTDVDNPFNTFIPVSSPTPSASGYGSFTMTAVGMWIYMLDNANSAVENLNNGDTLTDSFTVTTVDGTPQVVSITIHGATDADINDFDALATRATVTTEPPFVYGTTGADSIAGGGNDGQTVYGGAGGDTINGTGQADTIFAGSGNDTVKGNGGDDTIFGGSGIDTINGNNGDDTIVGGFGADNLTGSNGDDRFVYLSVADSNATRFDTITDFSSGSDRIDLTALGAFAFLALTSASTSVPPHTIAWIHDGATNQTIVYVNPTDQTLSIGSSALLEIHLQGVVAVASTDFIFAADAASASAAGEPINLELAATAETDGAVFAIASAEGIVDDADAKMQTSNLGFSLDADRDLPGSLPDSGHARIVSFREDRTQPTEVNENSIVGTGESGQSVVPHHLYFAEPTGFRFAFDPAPALDNTSAMTANDAMLHPDGAIHHASVTAPDAPGNIAELQPDVPGQGSEVGSGDAPSHSDGNNGSQVNFAVTPNADNLGLPEVLVNHGQAVASLAANSGEPPAHGNNNHSIPGDAGEHGSNPSHGAPSNAHGIGGNAPSHSHGSNGPQANPTIALSDDNLAAPEVSGNHGQAVASLVANSEEPPAHGNNHSTADDASEHGADPSHGANAKGMSGSGAADAPGLGDSFKFNHAIAGSESGGGNASSHSHGNGSQMNSTVAFNEDNLGVPEVSGNHGQAVASLVANSGEPPAHGNNHSIPGDEHVAAQSHGAPSGTPGLGDSFQFNHVIAGSVSSGIIEIELASHDLAAASTGRHANAAGNGQPGESQIIELSLPGNPADHFQGHPGNTHAQHDLMV